MGSLIDHGLGYNSKGAKAIFTMGADGPHTQEAGQEEVRQLRL